MSNLIMNNVVDKETMRKIQNQTLGELASILKLSFGPNGSNACIKKEGALSRYTKDGHSIIGALHYNGIIEQSIKDDIESITRHIVKTVGDGTTSAVILSSIIFNHISKIENEGEYKSNSTTVYNPAHSLIMPVVEVEKSNSTKYKPAYIVRELEHVVNDITLRINDSATKLTLQDVYDIAMISTNGNDTISRMLYNIYKEFGNSVFIDVTPSIGEETIIKSYNGMTLNTGYCDSCYVTNTKNNTSEVDHPQVYFFEHPIDTREMGVYLDSILDRNIVAPLNAHQFNAIIPTVIFAPTISQDMSAIMDSLVSNMANMPANNKLPICIITSYHEKSQLEDLARMCGAKLIRKYIDPKIYAADVERGIAPTKDNISEWAGRCDRVVAYSDKTVFIRPHEMYNEDGSYSEIYNNLVNFLEVEVARSIEDGGNIRETGNLKRRLHSLKSNMVELFIGGITQADRDSLRDLVEDAVLNIRSAANHGVGFGANMSASVVISMMAKDMNKNSGKQSDLYMKIFNAIGSAYKELFNILFEDADIAFEDAVNNAAFDDMVFNIRTNSWNTNVKSSIMSDITILDTVSRIIGIMATCNQFIVPTAMHNIYTNKN